MTYREEVLATADSHEEARMLARTLPRPRLVRLGEDRRWSVIRLRPAQWEPAAGRDGTDPDLSGGEESIGVA